MRRLEPSPSLLSAAGALLLALAACGGSAAPGEVLNEAAAKAQAQDYDAALAGFEEVLASPDATPEEKFRAARDSVVCAGAVGGDAPASEKFQRLLQEYPSRLTVDSLAKICLDLAGAGCIAAATEVFTEADRMAGEDEAEKAKLQPVVQSLEASGDAGAQDALKALGYVGD